MRDSDPEVKERFGMIFNFYTVIFSKIMRWVCHVACMRVGDVYTGFWYGNLSERDDLI